MISEYLLLLALLNILFVIAHYMGKKNRAKKRRKRPMLFTLLLPMVLCGVVIGFRASDTIDPSDFIYSEHIAHSIHRYKVDSTEIYTMKYQGGEVEIRENTWSYYRGLWETPQNNSLDSLGWNGCRTHSLIYTRTGIYDNYFKNIIPECYSKSCNHGSVEVFSRDLSEYVTATGCTVPRHELIYGIQVPDSVDRVFSQVSAIDPRFRVILMVWNSEKSGLDPGPKKTAAEQRIHWHGAKENEVIFCVRIASENDPKILWSTSFSSAETESLEEYILATSLCPGDYLDITDLSDDLIEAYGRNKWNPRVFSAYDILKISVTNLMLVSIAVVLLIISMFIAIRVLINWNKDDRDTI